MARGQLRIYLGAAPGVGKTYAMLDEAHRRKERGADVVAGFVETHGRVRTEELLDGLEVVPRVGRVPGDGRRAEMDVDAVLQRRPQIALVDELARANGGGSGNEKRWQDVEELLDAGITVLSTVNIHHLESVNDVVEQITGVAQHETVPDAVVRRADSLELVDMSPDALRRRMIHGNIHPAHQVNAALAHEFRADNLTALRELALLWLADKVDQQLGRYRSEHGVSTTWEARERVVVALAGGAEGETLIRRAARVAARSKGADLMAVHVTRGDGLRDTDPALLAEQRGLVESLGGTYHQVLSEDVPDALVEFAHGVNATQLVLGASRRGRVARALSPGVGATTAELSGSVDVHLVTHEGAGGGRRGAAANALSAHRRLAGFALALAGLPLVTLGPGLPRDQESLSTIVLLALATVTVVALVGGMWPAVVAAVGGFLLLNFFFTEPYRTFVVDHPRYVLALVVFMVVAVAVSVVVDRAARRTREAAQANAEAQTLALVAGSVLRGAQPLTALLERLRETFGLSSVTMLERQPEAVPGPDSQRDARAWSIAAHVGRPPCNTPAEGDAEVPIGDALVLVLSGPQLPARGRRIVEAFAAQAAVALRQERLAAEAAAVKPLAEADRMRTALLAAVSHDLRTPIAAAKAAVSSLRSREVRFDEDVQSELLSTADSSLDQLTRLVANLLDMSRLQAGALGVTTTDVGLEDAVPRALDELGPDGRTVTVDIPRDLPTVRADHGLLERVLVNVIGNAVKCSPAGTPPTVTANRADGQVHVRVIDRGPGVPEPERDQIFVPFQRFGDTDNSTGLGLGLALSRGLTEAMGGTLLPETTPGGGLTMCVSLPAVPGQHAVDEEGVGPPAG
ncbi:osmosensitive K+ channel signal transduction histidine kinase [Haloactinopolyspora alba]|uniref:histidine kinase n=1 Tax=Haloactinopolyspora alba TaxID=648780 RepID=A0A2P8EF00_9ACTN|nr:DUF4118 domain-containing protein [Haloactinopolyspora alba]PSL08052.1 osmosensitive K+ channel signal transduction histidine kinase [Haloactinopolyspora alba]